jgi:hypothetical protein
MGQHSTVMLVRCAWASHFQERQTSWCPTHVALKERYNCHSLVPISTHLNKVCVGSETAEVSVCLVLAWPPVPLQPEPAVEQVECGCHGGK